MLAPPRPAPLLCPCQEALGALISERNTRPCVLNRTRSLARLLVRSSVRPLAHASSLVCLEQFPDFQRNDNVGSAVHRSSQSTRCDATRRRADVPISHGAAFTVEFGFSQRDGFFVWTLRPIRCDPNFLSKNKASVPCNSSLPIPSAVLFRFLVFIYTYSICGSEEALKDPEKNSLQSRSFTWTRFGKFCSHALWRSSRETEFHSNGTSSWMLMESW